VTGPRLAIRTAPDEIAALELEGQGLASVEGKERTAFIVMDGNR
jgi:quercetin dioxygenase-like cupin family protein